MALPVVWPARRPMAALVPDSPTADPSGLTAGQQGPQVWARWNNRLITSYRAHQSQKYPYLYPVAGPVTGLSLTSESALPWPHHRSLWFACDRVNGCNFWQEENDQGQVVSGGPVLGAVQRDAVEIQDQCEWRKPGGPLVMRDLRRIQVRKRDDRRWLIDWHIQWTAVQDVQVQKTNHSLFALRVAPDIAPTGGGRLVNAEGLAGEQATFGKKSAWCDFSGARAGVAGGITEGIALMDHPANPWYPCAWFTRDYGFISPTPFNFIDKPWSLSAGQSVALRYRVVLHGGDAREADLPGLFKEWAAA
jgi:hypothetical protein